jgi:hypothetical protein
MSTADMPTVSDSESRDPWLWPFASSSIWNAPIGTLADYGSVDLAPPANVMFDEVHIVRTRPHDPTRQVFAPKSWQERAGGTNPHGTVPLPDSLVVPDCTPRWVPNNHAAILHPDGRMVSQFVAFTRPKPGGPLYGARVPDDDIFGPGMRGPHRGSGLSALGGTIRRTELVGSWPIRHAVKLGLWAQTAVHYSEANGGLRWPANRANSYASKSTYGGEEPELVMGSLLAILPSVREAALEMRTVPGRKLFHVLQDYGAYVVDDTMWDCHTLCVEVGVAEEVSQRYGPEVVRYDREGQKLSGAFCEDMRELVQALYVVRNNAPGSAGGGGAPRAVKAPPFDSMA